MKFSFTATGIELNFERTQETGIAHYDLTNSPDPKSGGTSVTVDHFTVQSITGLKPTQLREELLAGRSLRVEVNQTTTLSLKLDEQDSWLVPPVPEVKAQAKPKSKYHLPGDDNIYGSDEESQKGMY